MSLTQESTVDFWKELRDDLAKMLTSRGKETLAINATAGVINITDRPGALDRVANYLDSIASTVHRQVDIEARLYDVTMNEQFQFGVDWAQAIKMYGGSLGVGGAPTIQSMIGGQGLSPSAFTMVFENANTQVLLKALQEQGELKVISKPRIRTMNNQTALIKVGTETPFFSTTVNYVPGNAAGSQTVALLQDTVTTITVGTILSLTPQISTNEWITLDVSPVLTSLIESKSSPLGRANAPVLDIKQASTLIRVRDGSTIVMGGLIQSEEGRSKRKVPVAGDIPLLGKLFQGRARVSRNKELVIFLTPRIVE